VISAAFERKKEEITLIWCDVYCSLYVIIVTNHLKPNTHRWRRRDSTVGVSGVYWALHVSRVFHWCYMLH